MSYQDLLVLLYRKNIKADLSRFVKLNFEK